MNTDRAWCGGEETYTNRSSHEDRGRDWSDTATSLELPEGGRNRFFPRAFRERAWPCHTLISNFSPPGLWENTFLSFKDIQVCNNLLPSLRIQMHSFVRYYRGIIVPDCVISGFQAGDIGRCPVSAHGLVLKLVFIVCGCVAGPTSLLLCYRLCLCRSPPRLWRVQGLKFWALGKCFFPRASIKSLP